MAYNNYRNNGYRRNNYRGGYSNNRRRWSNSRPAYYARRAGGYARRAAGYAKRGYSNGIGVKGLRVYPKASFLAGVLLGLTDLDSKIPGDALLVGAGLPLGGRYGHMIRNTFGGALVGEVLSKHTGFSIPILGKTAQNKNNAQSVGVTQMYTQ